MSLDGNRCVNCGARMKLVNVTRINTFRAPEASQYDVSVSHRKAGSFIQPSVREYLCTCCGYRIPAEAAKVVKEKRKAKGKTQSAQTEATKKSEKKKGRVGFWIKLLIFLVIVAVIAYFAYQYKDTIMAYWDKFMGIVDKAKGFIDKISSKF